MSFARGFKAGKKGIVEGSVQLAEDRDKRKEDIAHKNRQNEEFAGRREQEILTRRIDRTESTRAKIKTEMQLADIKRAKKIDETRAIRQIDTEKAIERDLAKDVIKREADKQANINKDIDFIRKSEERREDQERKLDLLRERDKFKDADMARKAKELSMKQQDRESKEQSKSGNSGGTKKVASRKIAGNKLPSGQTKLTARKKTSSR